MFETGEIQQTEQEVTAGGETRHFRLSKIPMRLDGDEITHVITIGEDVTEWQRGAAADPPEREARGHRPARRRRHARDQQPARHHRRVRRGDRGPADDGGTRATARPRNICEIIDKEVERCTPDRGRAARLQPAQGGAERPGARSTPWWTRPCSCSSTTSGSSSSRWCARWRPACPTRPGSAEQLIQVLMALHAQRARRDGAGRPAHRAHRPEPGPGRTRSSSRWRTPASGSRGTTRPRSSSRSTPPSRRGGAPASASPSATASWRTTRAASRWTARRAGAPPSGSSCRCAA